MTPIPPSTSDTYVDSCFQFDFEELEENREWRQMDSTAGIPHLAASGREKEALAVIEKALKNYPDFDFLYTWRGHLQGRLGLRDEQRKTFLEGIQKCRSKISLCDQLGQWEFEANHLAEAVQWWIKSCAAQLSTGRMGYPQPFLRLAYIAEGLRLVPCRSALLKQVDRIDNVRLNAEGKKECCRLAASQGNASIKRAISLLCEFYLWDVVSNEEDARQSEARGAIENPEAFKCTFERHLERMKSDHSDLRQFLDQYFSASWVTDLAPLAEEEMQKTLADGNEHGVELPFAPVYYQICSLKGSLEQARDWFARKYGGYTKGLESLWNSHAFCISGCSVLCHIVYLCTDDQAWVQLAICPVGESPPVDRFVTPIEFLSADERRRFGVDRR